MTVIERFMRYIALDTTSDESCPDCPSSPREWPLANLLADEMRALGMEDVRVDEHAYVYGFLPANAPGPAIGLIAHMDTVDAVPASPMNARRVHYTGGAIALDASGTHLLTPEARHIGHDLIVTDGNTLLGADDKAGVAEIMTLCEYLTQHPEIRHGKICVGFTPDEEIGRGADLFDVPGFGADFAYTVDGGNIDELEYENFNAAAARVTVRGFSIHPGSAKGRMRNAATMAMQFHAMLPAHEIPECTEGYEGFYHLCGMQGETQKAELTYIIRDHDRARFEEKKVRMRAIADYLNAYWGEGTFTVDIRDSYYNMREKVEENMQVVARAMDAIRACGLTPACVPIRGGTDGARLSFMGLLCPNLGTGGCNCHGVNEYASVQDMEKMVEILTRLVSA
ncbi:MAG: peptidase T [Clostridiales bacterium]|nr:peptidase T [Clostridiales bacterium]